MKTYVLFVDEYSENPWLFTGDIANLDYPNWVIFECLPSSPIFLPISVIEAEGSIFLKRIK